MQQVLSHEYIAKTQEVYVKENTEWLATQFSNDLKEEQKELKKFMITLVAEANLK